MSSDFVMVPPESGTNATAVAKPPPAPPARRPASSKRPETPRGLLLLFAMLALAAYQTLQMDKLPSFNASGSSQFSLEAVAVRAVANATVVQNVASGLRRLVNSKRKDFTRTTMPLDELTKPANATECVEPTKWVANKKQPDEFKWRKRIPNIIHQTSKSRCLHTTMHQVLSVWQDLQDYEYYFHDDDAIWRLIDQPWPEFPHLKPVLKCLQSMTAVTDVWRYLVLWEYGGIYADLDSKPASWTPGVIREDDDAYFVVEFYDAPSQYWMAVSPKHPLMYYAIQQALYKVMGHSKPHQIDASFVTGPFALLDGFSWFMLDMGEIKGKPVVAGTYQGRYNRSVRIDGMGRKQSDKIIKREAIGRGQKMAMYHAMNMTHFFEDRKKGRQEKAAKPCFSTWYDVVVEDSESYAVKAMTR